MSPVDSSYLTACDLTISSYGKLFKVTGERIDPRGTAQVSDLLFGYIPPGRTGNILVHSLELISQAGQQYLLGNGVENCIEVLDNGKQCLLSALTRHHPVLSWPESRLF